MDSLRFLRSSEQGNSKNGVDGTTSLPPGSNWICPGPGGLSRLVIPAERDDGRIGK